MNELLFPGLYINAATNPRAVLPYLCDAGFYCLVLATLSSELDVKYGRLHYDYQDSALITFRADATCVEVPTACLWMVAFHPELGKSMTLEKQLEAYSFLRYAPNEALHASKAECQMLTSCFNDIRKELHQNTDQYKLSILGRHMMRLFNYITRFHERQFIMRESVNEGLIQRYEALIRQSIDKGRFHRDTLTSAYCAKQLHLSEAYFKDLLEFHFGHTHNCHLQLKRIEFAKEILRTSQAPLSQIVRELGFPSVQYFSFLFKKIVGIAPNEYRWAN